jgi:hypothetical protein
MWPPDADGLRARFNSIRASGTSVALRSGDRCADGDLCFPHSERQIMFRLPTLRLLGATLCLGLVAACGGSDDDSFDDRADVADPKVRFVHAVPGAPNVTLTRNGAVETDATNVAYKGASQYYDVDTEIYTFVLRTADGSTELDSAEFRADRGNRYTLVALPTDSGAEMLMIRDPYNKSVTSDDARVRVLNAAVNAPAFDVYVTGLNDDLAVEEADIENLTYKEVAPESGDDSLDLEQGEYRVRLTLPGDKTAFFDVSVTVPEDGDWLLIALPEDDSPNNVRILLVKADDSDDATDELVNGD